MPQSNLWFLSYLLIWTRKVNYPYQAFIMIKQVTANNTFILVVSLKYQCIYLIHQYYHQCIIIFATDSNDIDINSCWVLTLIVTLWHSTIPFSTLQCLRVLFFSEMFCVLQENSDKKSYYPHLCYTYSYIFLSFITSFLPWIVPNYHFNIPFF